MSHSPLAGQVFGIGYSSFWPSSQRCGVNRESLCGSMKKGFLPSPFKNFKPWEGTSLFKLFNSHFHLKALIEHPNIQGPQGTSPLKPFNSHFPFKTFNNKKSQRPRPPRCLTTQALPTATCFP
ncbi:unnamed protein product [Closterium sp. Yama58-4]|nr:unnamed protein product [Closterium sp. Yama58-4]